MSNAYLTTDEAMKALKISRITLYRWAKAGKIPFTKVGTTYRFKKEDIDNFLLGVPSQTSKPKGILAPSRTPLVVTACDIELWASHGNKVAEEKLPELVRRLLQSTRRDAGLNDLHIPSSDSVGQPGWDGKVRASNRHIYVPEGVSAWEMGVGEPQNKATADYTKRTEKPLNITPKETTFVFVTAQTWADKEKWVATRNAAGEWADVRVLDANDLEAWLDLSPATKHWFMGILGRPQHNVSDLETYWEEWRAESRYPFTVELVIAGRDGQKENLQSKLKEATSSVTAVSAASRKEAIAFVLASVMSLPDDESEAILSSSLVIESQEAWHEVVASSDTPLVLIAAFDDPQKLAVALSKGHKIIIPVDKNVDEEGGGIVLGNPKKEVIKTELEKLGASKEESERLAALGRHSLLSLWRRLATTSLLQAPEWVSDSTILVPALLVGKWDENSDADRKVIADLASLDYDEYIERLVEVKLKPDSPVGKVGTKWFIASKDDAWELLSSKITPKQIQRFISAASEVLSEVNPAYSLPYEDRWMANIHGKKMHHSSEIRENIADTLAFLSARLATKKVGEIEGGTISSRVAVSVFDTAHKDSTGHLWATLSDVLPLLSEAAPVDLLTALEKELNSQTDKISYIFQDKKEDSSFSSSSPHPGFLWALENLAWTPDYLLRASYILCRLHELDPGGRLANRPLESLRHIFLTWHPQTTASVAQRKQALEKMVDHYPNAGWKLLIAILPEQSGFTTGSHNPKWQEWKPEKLVVTYVDLYDSVDAISELLLKQVGNDASKWADLLENFDAINTKTQDDLAAALMAMPLDKINQADQALIWDSLRSLIYKNKRFSKQSWALKEERIDKLLPALSHLEPTNTIDKYKWLFGHHLDIPIEDQDDDDMAWKKYDQKATEARIAAIVDIYNEGRLDLVLELIPKVQSIHLLGVSVGRSGVLKTQEYEKVLMLLGSGDAQSNFAKAVVIGKFYPEGWDWAKDLLNKSLALSKPAKRADFLNELPLSKKTWSLVDASNDETQKNYWKNCSAYGLDDDKNYIRLADETIKAGSPYTAIEALSLYIEKSENKPESDLIFRAFEGFIKSDPSEIGKVDFAMFSHHASRLLEYLDEQEVIDKSRLAQIEWGLLPALRNRRRPKILHDELATNPKFFSEVVSWVYRKRGAPKKKLAKGDESRASLGYDLLDSWNQIPGYEDGVIDEAKLAEWITQARKLLKESGRIEVGDQIIGKMLSTSPVDADGAWPMTPVRNVIEMVESDNVEQGISMGIYNSRGVTTRSIGEGGGQERELAKKYDDYAQKVLFNWPHTATVLLNIAKTWRHEAERHDIDALEDEIT